MAEQDMGRDMKHLWNEAWVLTLNSEPPSVFHGSSSFALLIVIAIVSLATVVWGAVVV